MSVGPVGDLRDRVRGLAARPGRSIVGIAGPPGSGKSTLVELVLAGDAAARFAHVPMDGFHLADAALGRLGLLSRKGAPETFDVDGYAALLQRLRVETDRTVYAPAFERGLEQPVAGSIAVPPEVRVVLTEGNYLLLDAPGWARVRSMLDEVWYVEVDDAVRRTRLVERHERFGKSPSAARAWTEEVDEPNAALVRGTRDAADRVVSWEGEALPDRTEDPHR